jgi:hypothetical protein
MQRAHITEAQQDRSLYATVNHGKPSTVVASHPFTATNRPADFKPLAATGGTSSKAASEPAHKSAPNPKSAAKPAAPPQHAMKPAPAHSEGKGAPAHKPGSEKAPHEKATHAPA